MRSTGATGYDSNMQATQLYPTAEINAAMREIDLVRDRIARRTGVQPDSTKLIRDLRSGKRDE